MIQEHLSITSEINELEDILSSIPEENVIERRSFQQRLDAAKLRLEGLLPYQERQKALLTFRGRPVFGSHGIAADFGSRAATAFADAFATVVASLNTSFGYSGPIPDKAKHQLLITGTAVGSFGFEFELPDRHDLLLENRAEESLNKLQDLLRVSAEGTDDEVTELVEAVHPRAVKKVAEFLEYLAQQDAFCGLEFKDHIFKFSDIRQLRYAKMRLQDENIHEYEEQYAGEFLGVLPNSRTFEFKRRGTGEILKGKIDFAIQDPDVLNQEWLHKETLITFHVIQVGNGRPRYILRELPGLNRLPAV